MNVDLVRRYRAFRAMGLTAIASIFDARAEQRAEAEGLRVVYEPEQERYEDVYGEPPPKGAAFYWVAIYRPEDRTYAAQRRAVPLASLGFVQDDPPSMRWEIANLYAEALGVYDAERDAAATEEASALAARATFAGPVQP